jgi:hypothetical protein
MELEEMTKRQQMYSLPKILFLILVIVPCVKEAFAETTCKTEIFYRWKEKNSEEEQKSLWTLLSVSGGDSEEVRRILQKRVVVEKTRADKECKRLYERLSVCISSKLLYRGASLKSLDFSARRMVEESIKEECESHYASCLSAMATELVCVEQKTAEADEEGKEEEDKDKKKGGKK